jgi:hypothetical protein
MTQRLRVYATARYTDSTYHTTEIIQYIYKLTKLKPGRQVTQKNVRRSQLIKKMLNI